MPAKRRCTDVPLLRWKQAMPNGRRLAGEMALLLAEGRGPPCSLPPRCAPPHLIERSKPRVSEPEAERRSILMQFIRRHYYLAFALLAGPIALVAAHPVATKAVEGWGK